MLIKLLKKLTVFVWIVTLIVASLLIFFGNKNIGILIDINLASGILFLLLLFFSFFFSFLKNILIIILLAVAIFVLAIKLNWYKPGFLPKKLPDLKNSLTYANDLKNYYSHFFSNLFKKR